MSRLGRCMVFVLFAGSVFSGGRGDAQRRSFVPGSAKKPLEHGAYDSWNKIQAERLSPDGNWVLYSLVPGDGDSTLRVRSTVAGGDYEVLRGGSARFTRDSRTVVCLVKPDKDEVKKAKEEAKKTKTKKAGKAGEDASLPKSSLVILRLFDGTRVEVSRVKSFKLPEESGSFVAFLLEKPVPAEEKGGKGSEGGESENEEEKSAEEKPEEKKEKKEKKKDPGTTLVLRSLESEKEFRFENVVEYAFSEDGSRLGFATSGKAEEDDGVFVVSTESGNATAILRGRGHYKSLAVDKKGSRVAFLTDRDDYAEKDPDWKLYSWTPANPTATVIAERGSEGLPSGWSVSSHRAPSYSENDHRLFFGIHPKAGTPESSPTAGKEKEEDSEGDEKPGEEKKVKVDIWHWRDALLQPQQLIQLEREKKRSYLAMIDLRTGDLVQLATEEIPDVTVGERGDGPWAVGHSDLPYRMEISWDWPRFSDCFAVEVKTGKARLIAEKLQGRGQVSPESRYITWWDPKLRHWLAYSTTKEKVINLTEKIPFPVHNELHDLPSHPRAYGSVGWVEEDLAFIVYDRYDLWLTTPVGFWPPVCLTDGVGRKKGYRLRAIRLDREKQSFEPFETLLFSSFDEKTKASGFFTDRVRGGEEPRRLLMMDERFSTPVKAKDGNKLLLTRSTYEKFPDLWVTDLDLSPMQRLSHANPQQEDYAWGTAELVEWVSLDGGTLQGILCKPEEFDPERKYPLLVYFYERNSDNLHQHVAPEPFRSIINRTFYTSRGYLVFVPDIPYKVGSPGESAVNAVLPGVTSLIHRGFVDEKRIGVQGHSWGGYQIAYMVTRTDLFAAAEAGAPVSNMTSAYGGIRWGSGMSRMFQYEKTQSRIGGTLWDAQQKYIENSPLFWADKIKTPLLMMHNDKDGAVPWYQGIELFVALRRLSKPAWLINYNDEPHNLTKIENKKDWAVRMQQFFDHYLLGKPAPVWLAEGVPALEKGKTLGLDLIEDRGGEAIRGR